MMALQNKLGIMDSIELAHEEKRLTKKRDLELYDKKYWIVSKLEPLQG